LSLIYAFASTNEHYSPAFSKNALVERSQELASFAVKRWPLTPTDLAEA